ncbi:hypothetical protein HMN09_00170900 [Mycena chlorophos]|uniref:Transmembrane protein n=1 Tax=Mycena chlorophos TaxID=658473 RepID=A0A8H6WQI1_MYCCL|nr:hypothetical protein HMN09_00170900 [Mycena chlorophos]
MLLIAHITVAQAATVINVLIAFFHYTLMLALVALLVYFLPSINPAVAWNVVGRKLHASLWPTLLRTDTSRGAGGRVKMFSALTMATTLLVAVAGVLMPLGLSVGPDTQAASTWVSSSFVADTSPLGLATSPRAGYTYGRICGSLTQVICPGGYQNSSEIAPDLVATFNSTPYGPFNMQFRRWYNGTSGRNFTTSQPVLATTESLILRDGIFPVGGLIVDLDNPGVGLWNHTLPSNLETGGVWSEEVLWLEPVSSCVDTNLTVDYTLQNAADSLTQIETYSLTDRGGFYNLTTTYPDLDRDGQTNLNLQQHAYKGAVLSNFYTMNSLNVSRNTSHDGRSFPLKWTQTTFFAGRVQMVNILYMGSVTINNVSVDGGDLLTSCEGYGGLDTANISNVAVHCTMFLGPPQRTDGGDPQAPSDGSTWTQRLFSCAGATRARMQQVNFSYNGTRELTSINITRSDINTPVLWATENQSLNITDIDIFWGRVAPQYQEDPSLSTIMSDVFYVPAGATDTWGVTADGQPGVAPALAWGALQADAPSTALLTDYSGATNFALLAKYQQLMLADPVGGAAKLRALIWTDIMANNLLGTDTSAMLFVGKNVKTVAYDLRYAIPMLLLLILWVPSIVGSLFVLGTGMLRLSYLKFLLANTSAGRIAIGDSALRPMNMPPTLNKSGPSEKDWAKGPGTTPVWVETTGQQEDVKELLFQLHLVRSIRSICLTMYAFPLSNLNAFVALRHLVLWTAEPAHVAVLRSFPVLEELFVVPCATMHVFTKTQIAPVFS